MSKPDKATTERNSKILRELVRKPDNKVCADCKRNDPRWASWNLGVFLCIRCSGIHRGMGTHISKVKSVDLDAWTPEQMNSIQKWGNRLANLYWEAHLKPGHVPPEHKMESFIRSKYESKRWAMEGPLPSDPSVLDNAAPQPVPPVQQTIQQAPSPPPQAIRQPQHHKLLSANITQPTAPPPQQPQQPQPAVPAPPLANADLFTLDFHQPAAPPTSSQQPEPPKNVKQDILSLFSQPQQPSAQPSPWATQQAPQQSSPWASIQSQQQWNNPQQPQQQWTNAPQPNPQQPQSLMGNNGVGMWGASSGWTAPPPQDNLWGNQTQVWGGTAPAAQPQQPNMFGNDVWGGTSTNQPKKDDAFGDIWGGFK